jgi:protein tyrosine phosphatase (PTP) superfamily phosphohydrolase (DUF442 family)
MGRFARYHGSQVLVAAAMVVAALAFHQRRIFIDNFGIVRAGVLYRCGQLHERTAEVLVRYGISKDVNLRARGEQPACFDSERRTCEREGVSFAPLPVTSKLPGAQQIEEFLVELRARRGPVLVHCHHGEDRTGIMVAAYRVVLQDWPVGKAVAEMRRFRCRLRGAGRDRALGLLTRLKAGRRQWPGRTNPDSLRPRGHPAPSRPTPPAPETI